MTGVAVKQLSAGDEAEVARFDEAFDRAVDPGLAARYLADERHHLPVATVDGEPAGYRGAGGEWDGANSVMFEIQLTS